MKKCKQIFISPLKVSEEMGDKNNSAINLGNIGIIYKEQGDYDRALSNLFKALKISEELGDKFSIANDLGNIGNIYAKIANYGASEKYLKDALRINKSKKFMSKNLKELLSANAHLPMQEQKKLLENTFKNWVGNLEQVDDVTLIGVRI